MLENLENLTVLRYNISIDIFMLSKKLISVPFKDRAPDNQQERLKTIGWIVGYVDGEGCFSVSIIRNKKTKYGWQVFPEFVITQGEKSIKSLEIIQNYFECGKIYINRRHDNHNENIHRYCIRSLKDLSKIIIPFFEKNKLRTDKKKDFTLFVKIIKMMNQKKHYKMKGIKQIATLIQKMNRKKPSKFLESSETKRQCL